MRTCGSGRTRSPCEGPRAKAGLQLQLSDVTRHLEVTQADAPALGVEAQQLVELGPEGYRLKTATVDGRRVTLIAGGTRVGV